jgi:hypothetical protein
VAASLLFEQPGRKEGTKRRGRRRRPPAPLLILLLVIALVGSTIVAINQLAESPDMCTADDVTGVQLIGQAAPVVVREGSLPAGTADGPAVTATRPAATTVNGGSLLAPIKASSAFRKLLVGLPGAGGSVSGSTGRHYEIIMATPADSAVPVLTFAQHLPCKSFVLHIAAVDEQGRQGVSGRQVVNVSHVGTGQVQVTLAWDATSDVDLHVIDPKGDEIYYDDNHRVVPSGGKLDLDSNQGCIIDDVNNENITWKDNPPEGVYTVRVDYFNSCGVAETKYAVKVHVAGQDIPVFTGSLTGPGDHGDAGSGKLITTFKVGP